MPDISAIVILNSRSGRGSKGDLVHKLRSMAAALDVACDIVSTTNPSSLIEAARMAGKSSHDVVIAGGGDGTINAIASELIGTGKGRGVVPLGTFNYFAREMGVTADLEVAFRTCFEGETRSITVGEVNGKVFLNDASIGLDPLILGVREQSYRRWGRSRFLAYWS